MATITQETRFELAKRELVGFSAAGDHVLDCETGELWLTFEGNTDDVILGAGQSLRIGSDAKVIVSALKPSTLRMRYSQSFGSLAEAARDLSFSMRHWRFPPLAAFPAPLIR